MRQSDDGRDEHAAFSVAGQTGRKSAIDFQRVDRQLGQAAERGEAGSEIIDSDAYPRGAQQSERVDTQRKIPGQCALGHFDIYAPIRVPGDIAYALEDFARGVAPAQFWGRNIDGNSNRRQTHVLPLATIECCLPYDPGADCSHESCGFEQGQKDCRRDEPVFRIVPAQQRLGAGDLSGAQRYFRLVVEHELLLFQSRAQSVLHSNSPGEFRIHLDPMMEILLS